MIEVIRSACYPVVMNNGDTCKLCGYRSEEERNLAGLHKWRIDCVRCGSYRITDIAYKVTPLPDIESRIYLLSGVTRNAPEDSPLEVRSQHLNSLTDFNNLVSPYASLEDSKKEQLILKYVARKSEHRGANVRLVPGDDYPVGYCKNRDEFIFYVEDLCQEELLTMRTDEQPIVMEVVLTTKGWQSAQTDEMPNDDQQQITESKTMTSNADEDYEYDVALSFAGEHRAIAEEMFNLLKSGGANVFYDYDHMAELWGTNGYDQFSDVYQNKARYCIMLISKEYAEKAWPNLERKNAQARAFEQRTEYILPVRIDDTPIPGLPSTTICLDLREQTVEDIVQITLEKLGKHTVSESPPISTPSNIPLPNVKRQITERDRDKFLRQSYDEIRAFFELGVKELEKQGTGIEADVEKEHNSRFVARAYVNGAKRSQCKIWIGGMSEASIAFSNQDSAFGNDSSMNDWLVLVEAEGTLLLKASGMAFMSTVDPDKLMTQKEAAEYYWKRFIEPLER